MRIARMNLLRKTCSICKIRKPVDLFGPEKRVRDGRKAACRGCAAQASRGREEYYREHYRKNRERRLAWMRENFDSAAWNRNRRLNPKHRIDNTFGNLMRHSLRTGKGGKKWCDIVGYTVDDLISHLYGKFLSGMSMNNYGEWHVDHIKPVSSFNYETFTDPQFQECWSLGNLQPLWAVDNIRKGARIA